MALAAHSHAAWEGCQEQYASDDCSGDDTTTNRTAACVLINAGCTEDIDSTNPSGNWTKTVSTSATCVDGAVISNGRYLTAALCEAATGTAIGTIGECVDVTSTAGNTTKKIVCGAGTAGSASVAASAMVVLLAAVASQMF